MLRYVLLCALLLSLEGLATERLNIYTEKHVPYNFLEQDQPRGINLELVQRSCELAGIHCQFHFYPWLRAFDHSLKDEQGGLMSTSRSPQREKLFQWVGPLVAFDAFFYRLRSRTDLIAPDLEHAKAYSIGVVRGDVYEQLLLQAGFEHGKNLLDFPSHSTIIKLFMQGKIDLILGSELTLPYRFYLEGQDVTLVEPVLEVPSHAGNYLALNLAVPAAMRERLQVALERLRQDGEFTAIIDRYKRFPVRE